MCTAETDMSGIQAMVRLKINSNTFNEFFLDFLKVSIYYFQAFNSVSLNYDKKDGYMKWKPKWHKK